MLGCIQPMSSPMMNKILGFCCGCCADTGTLAIVMATSDRAVVIERLLLTRMDGPSLRTVPRSHHSLRPPKAARHAKFGSAAITAAMLAISTLTGIPRAVFDQLTRSASAPRQNGVGLKCLLGFDGVEM